jgi:hypothetical protein
LQLVPLSPKIAAFLSSYTQAIWGTALTLGSPPSFRLFLYPYITFNTLILGAALLLFY